MTPAGTSNELDVQNRREKNTKHTQLELLLLLECPLWFGRLVSSGTINSCICGTKSTSGKISEQRYVLHLRRPTATVSRVGENQLKIPPSPAPLLMAPVSSCPSISVNRVRTCTHRDPTGSVLAVDDAGVVFPLQPLHHLPYNISVFFNEAFTELRDSAGRSHDICVIRGAHIIIPTARGMDFPASFPPPLWSCARLVWQWQSYRWYHGSFVDAEPVGGSGSSCSYISSSSLLVLQLVAVY